MTWNLSINSIGVVGDAPQVQESAAGERRILMLPQDDVLRDGELLDHAVPHALFRDVGEHPLCQLSRAPSPVTSSPSRETRPAAVFRRPVMTSANSH